MGFDDISPTWGPIYTVEQMLIQLRDFARKALAEHDINAQIFAGETAKSIALLDVFLHDYDVVVMNPPYGHTVDNAKMYLKNAYPITKNDLFMAFRVHNRFMEAGRKPHFISFPSIFTAIYFINGLGFRTSLLLSNLAYGWAYRMVHLDDFIFRVLWKAGVEIRPGKGVKEKGLLGENRKHNLIDRCWMFHSFYGGLD